MFPHLKRLRGVTFYLRTYVLGWPIYDTYVYEFLRMYPALRTVTYDVPCMVVKSQQNRKELVTWHWSLKGQEILVNRGWVAQSKLRPETRPQGQVEGEVNISGIVRKTEGRAQFAPKVRLFGFF